MDYRTLVGNDDTTKTIKAILVRRNESVTQHKRLFLDEAGQFVRDAFDAVATVVYGFPPRSYSPPGGEHRLLPPDTKETILKPWFLRVDQKVETDKILGPGWFRIPNPTCAHEEEDPFDPDQALYGGQKPRKTLPIFVTQTMPRPLTGHHRHRPVATRPTEDFY